MVSSFGSWLLKVRCNLCRFGCAALRLHGCLQPKPTHPQPGPDDGSALGLRGQVYAGPSAVKAKQSSIVVQILATSHPSFGFGVVFARRASHAVTQHGVL